MLKVDLSSSGLTGPTKDFCGAAWRSVRFVFPSGGITRKKSPRIWRVRRFAPNYAHFPKNAPAGRNTAMYDGELLTTSSKKNLHALLEKVRTVAEENPSAKQEHLVWQLNPISHMMPKPRRSTVLPLPVNHKRSRLPPELAPEQRNGEGFFRQGFSVVPNCPLAVNCERTRGTNP
jgi:hypothetical protein